MLFFLQTPRHFNETRSRWDCIAPFFRYLRALRPFVRYALKGLASSSCLFLHPLRTLFSRSPSRESRINENHLRTLPLVSPVKNVALPSFLLLSFVLCYRQVCSRLWYVEDEYFGPDGRFSENLSQNWRDSRWKNDTLTDPCINILTTGSFVGAIGSLRQNRNAWESNPG